MWSVLKTKALSPSGTIVWSCRTIDRYCDRPITPAALEPVALREPQIKEVIITVQRY